MLALVLFVQIDGRLVAPPARDAIPYSEFLNRVDEGSVKQVDHRQGRHHRPAHQQRDLPHQLRRRRIRQLIERLREKGVAFEAQPEAQTRVWTDPARTSRCPSS